MHMYKICLSSVLLTEHIAVAAATVVRVSYKNTNNVQTVSQNVYCIMKNA